MSRNSVAPQGDSARAIVRRYTIEGESIRDIAADLGWTYGKTRRFLVGAGAIMRRQGRPPTTSGTAS